MNTAIIISAIKAIIAAAPDIARGIEAARNWIAAIFGNRLITSTEQETLKEWIETIQTDVNNGITPPELQVQPNPQQ